MWYNKVRASMTEIHYTFQNSKEYDEWIAEQTAKSVIQIEDRLANIKYEAHFGIHKELGDGVCELKWGNGRRVYYTIIPEKNIILLLGGNKNGQDKDIGTAKKIRKRYL
jgi:putative addiction module killer protein